MNYRSLGRDDVSISEVGLGCWQLGSDWGEVDETKAKGILNTSIDNGVNFFDTADVYGDGRSERIIGDCLKESGSNGGVFVATKVGRLGLYPNGYSRESVTKRIEDSLRRLRVDALDLAQTHCVPTEIMKSGEIFEWLSDLVVLGKIKRFGASVETVDEANMLIKEVPGLYSLQVIFNMLRQKPIEELFEAAKQNGVGIIARVPLASGILSGKFTKSSVFADNDHRNYNRDGDAFNVGETFGGIPFDKAVEFAEALDDYRPPELTLAQVSLRWILDYDAVSVAIPGATKVEQALANSEVSELNPLGAAFHERTRLFYESKVKDTIRGPY